MDESYKLNVFDLVMSISTLSDLISTAVSGHQKRVAYIAQCIGAELGLAPDEQQELVIAGSLHDIGAFSLKERLDTLEFEFDNPHKHALIGYLFLKRFRPFQKIALIVKFHHLHWENGLGNNRDGEDVPFFSHIINLADRVDVLVDRVRPVLGQIRFVCARICENKGSMFAPDAVAGFLKVAAKESFWLDTAYPSIEKILARRNGKQVLEMDGEGLLELGRFLACVIDFKSPYTSAHSSGVAACAEALAEALGFDESDRKKIRIAGLMHDLGKIALPKELLEKQGKLTDDEFGMIKVHPYFTRRILESIPALEDVSGWASAHHESLDGRGYPFRTPNGELGEKARLVAVADVYTALIEDRPYRPGMSRAEALAVLEGQVADGKLDGRIVALLEDNIEHVDSARMAAQKKAKAEYDEFAASIAELGD